MYAQERHIVREISQSVICMYNNIIEYNLLTLKGVLKSYATKGSFNASGVTLKFSFRMPYINFEYFLL